MSIPEKLKWGRAYDYYGKYRGNYVTRCFRYAIRKSDQKYKDEPDYGIYTLFFYVGTKSHPSDNGSPLNNYAWEFVAEDKNLLKLKAEATKHHIRREQGNE